MLGSSFAEQLFQFFQRPLFRCYCWDRLDRCPMGCEWNRQMGDAILAGIGFPGRGSKRNLPDDETVFILDPVEL
jgi:hypothetical protein